MAHDLASLELLLQFAKVLRGVPRQVRSEIDRPLHAKRLRRMHEADLVHLHRSVQRRSLGAAPGPLGVVRREDDRVALVDELDGRLRVQIFGREGTVVDAAGLSRAFIVAGGGSLELRSLSVIRGVANASDTDGGGGCVVVRPDSALRARHRRPLF